MKVRFNRWYNTVLTALLTMLGYGCSSSSTDEDVVEYGVVMYGTPYAHYVLKGSVTDEAGNPIQGINVKAPYGSDLDSQFGQIVETDAAGKFALKEFSSLRGHEIIFEDVDGEANGGLFQSDTIRVETLPKTQTEKGNGWYNGKYEVQADIKLKKK